MSYLFYSIVHNSFIKPLCHICGESAEYTGRGLKFRVTCGRENCIKEHLSKRKQSVETREKIREKRFEYLKKKLGESAWERRHKGKMSYLEQWFFDNVITRYDLLSKFDIVNEYPEYPYFIDFAFLNIKIAVELDGKQHFRNVKNINRDEIKQKLLINKGWRVFRIKFDELTEDKIKEFMEILKDPNSYSSKVLEPKLLKFYSSKKDLSEEAIKKRKMSYLKKEEANINKVKNSNIDFSKFGWVTLVSKLIDKYPQRVNKWMKKYCPDILEKAFLRGKNKKRSIKPIAFSKVEKIATNKGYYLDGNDIKNKRGKIVNKFNYQGYPCISILTEGKNKLLRLHRFKAYQMFGDKIYEIGTKVTFNTANKFDLSDNNICLYHK